MKGILMISYSVFVLSLLLFRNVINAANFNSILPDRYDGLDDDCLLPMEFGYCRAKVKRYYFDTRRMKCSMFFWGGCAGNANNFASLEECQQLCPSVEHDEAPKKSVYAKGPSADKSISNNSNNNNKNSNDRVGVQRQNFANVRKSDDAAGDYEDYDSK